MLHRRAVPFQSAPPVKGATGAEAIEAEIVPVSIRAPVKGATCVVWVASCN